MKQTQNHRLIALICTALTAGAVTSAHGEVQSNGKSAEASTALSGLTIDDVLTLVTQASGNVISVDAEAAHVESANQRNDLPSGSAMSATTTIDDILATAASTVATQAQGNVHQSQAGGTLSVRRQDAALPFQATISAPIIARTTIGAAGASAFTDLSVTSLASGNTLLTTSASGPVALGQMGDDQQGLIVQSNQASESAALVMKDVTVSGKLTGLAQASGNVASTVLNGQGVLGAGFNLGQTNTADQIAIASLTDGKLAGAGHSFGASAIGNTAAFGAATNGVIRQVSNANPTAHTTLERSTLNGAVSAQAVGNALAFADNTQATLVSQKASGRQTATITGADLILNGSTSFSAVALGNRFSGSNAPGVAPGAFWQQEATGPGQTASITIDKASSDSAVSFEATAVGNLADLTNPSGFLQQGSTPTSATVTVTNTSFNGGMSVSTTTMANMVVVH